MAIYLPPDDDNLQHVLGITIIRHGLSPISATWTIQNDDEYSMGLLFGTSSLTLEEVVTISRLDQVKSCNIDSIQQSTRPAVSTPNPTVIAKYCYSLII